MSQTITPSSLKASLAPNPTRAATVEDGGNVLGEFLQETLAMTKRLFIQLQRRPSTLIAGVIQPFMWLILFGALFYKAPQGLFGNDLSYAKFLAPGVIVFTAFSGALNAGLPVMFDREFGFLNRLLVAPLTTRYSIVAASTIYIIVLSFIQTASIVAASAFLGAGLPSLAGLGAIALIVFLNDCLESQFNLCSARTYRINRRHFRHQFTAFICQYRPRSLKLYGRLVTSNR